MPNINEYLDAHKDRFEQELCEFLRIPSISADPAYRDDIRRAAGWVAGQFERLGFAPEIVETSGHPLVYAESPHVPGAPTALVYGHYDVQPVVPLELWTTPPFEPTVRDGNLYARGASDDKGQMLTHLKSVEAWMATEGRLPMNLKFLIEGEEECGGHGTAEYVDSHRDRLACDCVVVSDSAQFGPGKPAITCGLRGIAYCELLLKGPNRDLHSGSFGGGVANPANALTKMLASLIDDRGRIQIPGFYDDVVPLTEKQRARFAELPHDEAEYKKGIGVSDLAGEEGFTTLERLWARPTFDTCGLWSGYQGEGAKTVLPSLAGAKISFRLVPNQLPEKIVEGLRRKLAEVCPPGIQMELIVHHGARGVLVPEDGPYTQAAARAIEEAFGVAPFYTREGGSIPICVTFSEALGVDTLLLGWGQGDDNAHSPNEKFSLADFHRGIKASARLWEELAICPTKLA
ncbi:MAG: dipeptidase [Pirellulaceae bacterium]|nr:dipeptidase [Pirellulaceae bacterium]